MPGGARRRAAAPARAPRHRGDAHPGATHPTTACLVAEADGELVGFVVAELEQGLLPGLLGRVAELFVVPHVREGELVAALVEGAVGWLQERGAGVVHWEVPEDDPSRLALADALGWQREAIRFATYPS